jgi:murein endopeptidase
MAKTRTGARAAGRKKPAGRKKTSPKTGPRAARTRSVRKRAPARRTRTTAKRARVSTAPKRRTASISAAAAAAAFKQLPQNGRGYYSFSPAGQQHGTDPTLASLQAIGAAWAVHPDARGMKMGIGDISLPNGGPMPPHTSGHQRGRNVDIRPARLDGAQKPIRFQSADYDRPRTQALVNTILADPNVSFILFNDPQITGVRPLPNHDNHLHVQLRQ